ncbi:protein TRM32-like [Hibiscus syriacus]|uniref:protein TRM32-like n=1 Tax=Hibiscus syriacus TaxID=106335 RepID=UPI0019208AED|nr:protein TRM32-like [Hibiscus syriacus]
MRSRSFPVCGLPYLQFSTLDLEHKQIEVWSLRQGEKSVAGTQSSQGSDSRRWNHFVMNRLKYFKQRIKQTLKQVSIKDANNKCRNEDGTDNEICNGGLNRMRREKLINDSLDRYKKLFQRGVSKEAYLHHSKSLRLSKEGQVPSRELHGPEIFRSISSLSDISFRSLLYAVSRDALSFGVPIRGILNYDANKEKDEHNEPKTITVHEGIGEFELVEAVIEAELQENMREGNNNDPSDLMEKISFRQEQESAFGDNPSRELSRPTSEGEADPSYNYVRDILELSGFLQSKCLHSWYSPDQPLNPSLFKELETFLHPGLECSSVDELVTNCGDDHGLFFNLVNEALVEISEKTSIYFPKPFSLMFPGKIVLREVWRKVSRNLAFQPEHDQSLDDIVGRNLEKDAWIIFQPQAESLALELEDLVFGELLDELLCL